MTKSTTDLVVALLERGKGRLGKEKLDQWVEGLAGLYKTLNSYFGEENAMTVLVACIREMPTPYSREVGEKWGIEIGEMGKQIEEILQRAIRE